MSQKIATAIVELITEDAQLKSGLDGAKGMVSAWSVGVGGLITEAFTEAFNGVKDLAQEAVGFIIKTDAAFEQSRVAIQGMFGPARTQEANAFFDAINAAATKMPFHLQEVQLSAQKMLAEGFNTNKVIPDLNAISNALSALGRNSDANLSQMVNVFDKINANGKLTTGTMQQMQRVGVPAFSLLAEGMGISEQKARDLVSKGLIPAQEGLDALTKGIDERFNGAADRASKTFSGMLTNVEDDLMKLADSAGKPIFNVFEEGLSRIKSALEDPAVVAQITKIGAAIGQWLSGALDYLTGTAIPTLVQAWPEIVGVIGDIGSIIGTAADIFFTLASDAVTWGAGIIDALASGIYAGAQAVIDAVNFVASIIADLMETHSPPKMLPKLPEWGAGMITAWLSGMKNADYIGTFTEVGDTVKSYLDGLAKIGKFDKGSVIQSVFGTEQDMTVLLDQIQQTGTYTQEAFDKVIAAAGPAGDAVRGVLTAELDVTEKSRDLAQAQADVDTATRNVKDAQDALNQVTQEYTEKLQPLNDQLAQLSEQEQSITRAQEKRKLGLDTSPTMIALKAQSAALDLQQKQNELNSINVDTAAKAAELQKTIDSSKTSQAAKDKAAQDLAQLHADAQKRSVDLQIQILTLQAQQGDTSQTQLDTLKLQGDQLTDQKTTLDDQKTAAEKLAQTRLDQAKREETAAKDRQTAAQDAYNAANKNLGTQKAIVTEMEKQATLMSDQATLMQQMMGAGAGGGGGAKGGGGKGGGLAGVGTGSGNGILSQFTDQIDKLKTSADDAKGNLGKLFNIQGFTDFKNNLDGIAKGFKDFGKQLDDFSKAAQPVVQDILALTKATVNGLLRPAGGPSTGNTWADNLTGQGNGPVIKMPGNEFPKDNGNTGTWVPGGAGPNGEWWTKNSPMQHFIDAFNQRMDEEAKRIAAESPSLSDKYGTDFANDTTGRKSAQAHDQGGNYIPPDAADYVTSQEDAIARQKKIYQSVADWAKGPEAKELSRASWNTLIALAPDDAEGFIKKANGFLTTIMGGVHFNAADAKNDHLLADHWSVELDSGSIALNAGISKMGTIYRNKLEAMNQDGQTVTRQMHTAWSKDFDSMESGTSDTMARTQTDFATKLTGIYGNLNTWGPQLVGKAKSIWDDLTGVTQKKSDEMATKHSNALIKMNQDSTDTFTAITSTMKKGMDDESAISSTGMGVINTNFSTGFGTTSAIVDIGMTLAHDKYLSKMNAMSDDNKTKLQAFDKNWEDSYASLPTTVATHMDNAAFVHRQHLEALNTDTGTKMDAVKTTWDGKWSSLKNTVDGFWVTVKPSVDTLGANIKNDLWGVDLAAAGANMVNSLISGINSRSAAANAAASGLADSTNRAFKNAQQMASPSKVWVEYGQNLPDALALGIAKMIDVPVNAIGDITDKMAWRAGLGKDKIAAQLDAIPGMLADFGKSLHENDPAYKGWFGGGIHIDDPKSTLFGGIGHAAISGLDAIAQPAQDSVSTLLTDTTTQATPQAVNVGLSLVQSIADGITHNLSILTAAFDTLRATIARGLAGLTPQQFTNGLQHPSLDALMPVSMFNKPNYAVPGAGGLQPQPTSNKNYTFHNTFNEVMLRPDQINTAQERLMFLRTGE